MKKSILAKLLAKENITIQHGNYHTAWFDIKDRVLGLPIWKDMSNDVYDLLIGHEVGHALETPFEGWHDSPEKLEGCPRSYINVIEDARIERKIKDRYAGLVGPMSRGYKKLFDDKFFGDLSDINWDEVKLIDKINLKAKVGAHIDVPFAINEQIFMDRAMLTDTFEDVVNLVRDIYEWTKENQEELLNKPEPDQNDGEQPNGEKESENQDLPRGHDDAQNDEDQTATGNDESHDSNAEDADAESAGTDERTEESDSNASQAAGSGSTPEQTEKSLTDEEFRKNEGKLIEQDSDGTQPLHVNEFDDKMLDKIVWTYKDLSVARKLVQDKFKADNSVHDYYREEYENLNLEDNFKTYIKEVRKNVNFAVKEFEMRKAAFRYSRSATSKTGSIDVNKVWSYKTNDDIFSRVTKLADAKNHGMMMLIDYSGSMGSVLSHVIDQVIHLSIFCKAVNIPFDVYAFTNSNPRMPNDWYYDDNPQVQDQLDGQAHHGGLSMPQLVSSTLNKRDFNEALFSLFTRKSVDYYLERNLTAPAEDYGSTPLNTALIASHKLIKKFVAKNNVQNMNFVVISDGETDSLRVVKNKNLPHAEVDTWRVNKVITTIGGNKIVSKGTRTGMTKALLENIQKSFSASTLGFFIANDRYQYQRKLEDVWSDKDKYDSWWSDDAEDFKRNAQKSFTKNRCAIFNKVLGYDDFYLLKSQHLNTEANEFDVDTTASKGQITNAFKKHSRSKKVNKVLLTQFGKTVAL